ncbi:3-deoxy-7-phosphoheptulonate synthase [Micromonospora sp. NPDC047548]|uniref:3-deoxy-7-phosphoheptulonate synthase n=1 Tax=Micromonospora sp. NPDC047548 TaxID=3155624 RepID=UPI0033FD8010
MIDQRIDRVVPLTTPALLLHDLPLDAPLAAAVLAGRRAVGRVLDRADDRLLVVVGPCSVHDPAAALDYAHRLREAADRHADDLLVVMRVYFEKPRSTVGWKGLINDPALDGSGDVNRGLRTARALLLDVLRLGLPVGCEFLDPITPQYIADTVSSPGCAHRRSTASIAPRLLAGSLLTEASCPSVDRCHGRASRNRLIAAATAWWSSSIGRCPVFRSFCQAAPSRWAHRCCSAIGSSWSSVVRR